MKPRELSAKIEPFDTFWEAPEDIEKGYGSFHKFYKGNYLKHLPSNKEAKILVTSCGPGYFVSWLSREGYEDVLGIDSDPGKIRYAQAKGLPCRPEHVFPFLENARAEYDFIFVEQEINHLTKKEILEFLRLCWNSLRDGGTLIVHSLNGANPITGSEALAQNFNHFNTFTEYSLRQVLKYCNFQDIRVIPLRLYVFYENPLNYMGLLLDGFLTILFRLGFMFYGKSNKIFTKKIAGICKKRL